MPKKVPTHQPLKKPKRPQRKRVSASKVGYNLKWRRFRIQFLRRNPLCVHCKEKGMLISAYHLDHIIPVAGKNDPNFYKKGNHQGLCASCHSKKTMKDRLDGR